MTRDELAVVWGEAAVAAEIAGKYEGRSRASLSPEARVGLIRSFRAAQEQFDRVADVMAEEEDFSGELRLLALSGRLALLCERYE